MEYNSVPSALFESEGRQGYALVKRDGTWIEQPHATTQLNARYVSCALHHWGHQRGDRVGVISHSNLEWSTADMGVMAAALITIGIYETSTAKQCAFIVNHALVGTCFVEDVDQAQKLINAREQMPTLKRIVLFNGEPPQAQGLELISFDNALDLGKSLYEGELRQWFDETLASIKPEDKAIIVYTSGTTGDPKGVVLTHRTMLAVMKASVEAVGIRPDDLGLVVLPLAHILQRTSNYAGVYIGISGAYAESLDKLVENFQEVRPTTFSMVPRLYEKIHARVLAEISRANPRRRAIFNWAVSVGKRWSELNRDNKAIPLGLNLQHGLAQKLVYNKIQQVFGGRVRTMISGGAPLSVEIIEFFDACGLTILEGYGLTETAAPCTVNRPDSLRFGTVGQVIDGVEIKIAADGEICVRGESIFSEYYNDPEATAEAFDDQGYFLTGDIGVIDDDGFLRITDRKKDIIVTAGGKNIAPQPIENALKSTGYISQAVVIGDRRKYLSALIALDPDEIVQWAKTTGIGKIEPRELVHHPMVLEFVQSMVDKVNADLPRYETIKRFQMLGEELTIERGEVTPTQKVKRNVVNQRYKDLIDAMYND
ncbi:MAG: long-chain fatty acid--CoA ligase [Candidatus Alcyoniella australis]|nr:long-chain fatty acid--CoA ligase [Candidatus Alcyoniella australis]